MKKILFLSLLGLLLAGYASAQNYAFPLQTAMWRTNNISVCWDNPDPSNATERLWVQQAIHDTWEKYSAIKFTGWNSAVENDANVHIYIEDTNPNTVHLGTGIDHMRKGVVLNFTFKNFSTAHCKGDRESCIKAVAVHEFGHVLGFAHEQNKLECKFDNCIEKSSGEDGDWHMNQCDLQSIMNYCNPDWNNKGLLSEGDIKALQHFYHTPGNRSGIFGGFELVHNSAIINRKNLGTGKINHQFNVFVTGDTDKLKDVEKVVYFLDDETFKNSAITVRSAENNFGLGLKVWGEFMIVAVVFNKSGDIQLLKHNLTFDDHESGTALQKNH